MSYFALPSSFTCATRRTSQAFGCNPPSNQQRARPRLDPGLFSSLPRGVWCRRYLGVARGDDVRNITTADLIAELLVLHFFGALRVHSVRVDTPVVLGSGNMARPSEFSSQIRPGQEAQSIRGTTGQIQRALCSLYRPLVSVRRCHQIS